MAKQLTVLERIENLEQSRDSLDKKLDVTFNQIRGQVSNAMEVIEATVGTLAESTSELEKKIDEKMKANREKRKQAQIEQENKQLSQMIEMGVLKVADTISAASLFVVRTFDAQGEVLGIGREQVEFSRIHPSVSSEFLGKEVGFIFESGGRKIEVLEIYEILPSKEVATAPITPVEAVSTES